MKGKFVHCVLMTKLAVILLMLIFGFIQLGHYWYSLSLRKVSKEEFQQTAVSSLPDSSIDAFAYNDIKNDIRWEEKGREFWLSDQLYDVVKQKVESGRLYLYCLKDSKEEKVIKQQLTVTSNNAGNSTTNTKAIKFTFPDLILHSNDAITCPVNHSRLELIFHHYTELSQENKPVSPPPQV